MASACWVLRHRRQLLEVAPVYWLSGFVHFFSTIKTIISLLGYPMARYCLICFLA